MRSTNQSSTLMLRRQLLQNAIPKPININPQVPLRSILPYVNTLNVTANTDFYVPIGHDVPEIDSVSWSLQVGGATGQTLMMGFDELNAMQFVERAATLANLKSRPDQFLTGHAVWRGVPFMALVELAELRNEARYASFRCANGYVTYLPLEMLKDAVLATNMNGEPLSRQHGYPVRLIVPGVYDYKSPKWLTHIDFTAFQPTGYFESRGWSERGEVQTTAMIFSPRKGEQVVGTVTFSGMAFAGNRRIDRVELSIDDGEWMPVPFKPVGHGIWTLWQVDWIPPADGDYLVQVRATDDIGFTQQDYMDTAIFPSGSSAIHRVVFRTAT